MKIIFKPSVIFLAKLAPFDLRAISTERSHHSRGRIVVHIEVNSANGSLAHLTLGFGCFPANVTFHRKLIHDSRISFRAEIKTLQDILAKIKLSEYPEECPHIARREESFGC